MKKIFLFFALLSAMTIAMAQDASLTVTFKFANIVEGYDHLCKTKVYIDGEFVGESKEVKESAGSTFTVPVPSGEHEIRIVNLAFYEGQWEEHTIENAYSIDCLWTGTHKLKSKNRFYMLFDIDSETYVSWKKMPKIK